MPLNPAILLGSNPAPDPLQNYAKILQLRNLQAQAPLIQQQLQAGQQEAQQRRLQIQQLQQAQADDQAGRKLFSAGVVPTTDQIYATLGPTRGGAVVKSLQDADEARNKAKKAKADAAEAEADYAGNLAYGVKVAGYSPDSVQAAIAKAHSDGYEQEAQQLSQIFQQNPQAVPDVIDRLIAQSPAQQKLANERTTADARKRTADIAEKKLPGELQLQGLQATDLTQRTTGTQPLSLKDQFQQKLDEFRAQNEKRRTDLEAGNLAMRQKEFQQRYELNPEATAASIANGDWDPATTRQAIRRNPGLMGLIKSVDPSFDEVDIDKRYNTLREFTNKSPAKPGGQIIALNTLIHHAQLYSEVADALNNGTFKPGNALYNKVATEFGAPPPTDTNLVARFLAGETGKVATGGVPAEGEINGILQSLSANASPDQIKGASKRLLQVAVGRAIPLQETLKDAKLDKKIQVIGPDGKTILQAQGFDPETLKPISNTIRVKNSRGQTGAFRGTADEARKAGYTVIQ